MVRLWFPLVISVFGLLAADSRAQELGATVQTNASGAVTNVVFRVWAPNATAVRVSGEFNNWATNSPTLSSNGSTKIWTGSVTNARPGQAYKYIITTTNQTLWRKDPRAREVRTVGADVPSYVTNGSSTQASVIYNKDAFAWQDGSFQPPFPNEIVMYELHVGTFHDPRPDDGEPATFYDAVQKLDYLRDLGVNMIALMPVSEFNGRHSWGYNPIALFAIEQAYGGPDGFKHFVNEAHKRGMAVQVDVVHNHYGDLAAPGASDLENFDGGNPYFYHGADEVTRPGVGRTKWGPRPRYSDPNVRQFIKDNIKMYLDEYKVWALRWDSPRNITGFDLSPGSNVGDPDTVIPEAVTMMQEINDDIRNRSVRYYSIAEDANSPGGYSGHWEISFHNVLFPRLLPLDTDGSLPAPFKGRLTYPTLNQRNTDNIGYRLETKEQPGFRVIFSENHDKCGDLNKTTDGARLARDFDPQNPESYAARKKTLLVSAITLSSAGTPMLFQGQEQLADGYFDAYVRLDWLRAARHPGIVRFHRDMIRLRRDLDSASKALTFTSLPQVDDLRGVTRVNLVNEEQGWMVYERRTENPQESIVVAANFSSSTRGVGVEFPSAGPWRVLLNSDSTIYGSDFGNIGPAVGSSINTSGGNNYQSFDVAPFSVVIFGKSAGPVHVADANANGIDDGWEILFGASNATADGDQDGFSNLDEFRNGTDPTVPDRASLAGSFNDWNIVTRNARWDPTRSVWRYVARFASPGPQLAKAYLSSGWVAGSDYSFNVSEAGTYEITYSPSTSLYALNRVDSDAGNVNGLADEWERFYFYPATSASSSANPDGDAFDNLAEFQRGSDPSEFDYPAMGVVGAYNGWNWSARNMRYSGHGVWRLALPFLQPPSGPNYKFGIGPTKDDDNWGQPTVEKPDGFKSNVDFLWSAGLSGWHLVSFNEKNFSNSVLPVAGGTDRDSDTMPDSWEIAFGLDPFADDRNLDADEDQVWNKFEYARGTSPRDKTDHYTEISLPGDWLPFAPRSAWLNNADPRLRMLWRPEINRWELLRYVPRQVNLEVRAANHPFGSGDWAGTSGNQLLSFPARGYYLVRFEESSKTFDPPVSMSTNDTDLDGLPDYWETYSGQANAASDVDLDGATALAEFARGSDPKTADKSSNMHVVGHVSNWSFTNTPMRWSATNGMWELLVFTARLQESPQRAKFVHVTNPLSEWNNPNWGDGFTDPPTAADGWADRDGADIAYHVPSLPSYVLFEFEEVWGRYRAGVINTGASGDTNRDGLPDDWASYHAVNDAEADPDGDGRPNIKEFRLGMSPRVGDGAALATRHPTMSLAGSFVNGWSPAGARMTLVDDFLWRIDRQITNPSSQAFKFNIGDWATQWGEVLHNGSTGRADGSENIALPNLGLGTYRFIFNEATLQYFVTRLDTYANRYQGIPPEQRRPRTGLAALNEYLFGGTSLVQPPSANLPVHSITNGRPRLEFIARIDDAKLSHIVESSTNLSGGWSTNGVTLMSTETTDFKSGLMRHIYEAKGDGHTRRFFRIRTSLQP